MRVNFKLLFSWRFWVSVVLMIVVGVIVDLTWFIGAVFLFIGRALQKPNNLTKGGFIFKISKWGLNEKTNKTK